MQKQTALVFGLIALVVHCHGHSKEEAKEAIQSFGASCDPQPTEADADALISMDSNPPPSTKCFMNCMMKQVSLLVDGKIDVDMLQSFMSMAYENKDTEVKQFGEECNKAPQNNDPCEQAFEFSKCIMKGMEANGMEIPKLS